MSSVGPWYVGPWSSGREEGVYVGVRVSCGREEGVKRSCGREEGVKGPVDGRRAA